MKLLFGDLNITTRKCLATSEAIYYFFKEYDAHMNKSIKGNEHYNYDGKYDNLLYYYILQFKMIELALAAKKQLETEKKEGIKPMIE